ncbi:hypothetical protein CJF31_00003068 [Rutstroemia sp. NJR-2017a BVV2]|nr:hypothetical protein CJF31_00001860 [Rutstroemia sp. NJR-2017a BVV2]PQE18430.1 hypothetical protein CJF31_00003068 [Rutstroemia sp. NJR-2017a BVV2]
MDSKLGSSHEFLKSLIVVSITDNNDKCLESVTVADAEEVEIVAYKMWGLPAASSREVVELEESLPPGDTVDPAMLAADVFRMPCASFKDQWEECVQKDRRSLVWFPVQDLD